MEKRITLHGKQFVPCLTRQRIADKVAELGAKITAEYAGRTPLLLAILNGSFVFAADLFRHLAIDAEITFVKLSSYSGTASTGKVNIESAIDPRWAGRDIIIVEDIIDTGRTLAAFLPELQKANPASVKIAAFLEKPDAQQFGISAHYTAFHIDNLFVVGYGLDYDGLGRNLPDLWVTA
jgi:hypoxanthine phosphoribosyltransferase